MKKTNKLWLALLLTVLVAALLAVGFTAAAEEPEIVDSGTSWTLDSNGLLILNSTGGLYDTLFEGRTDVKNVVILDGEDMIDAGMFAGCSNLKSIAIPTSVEIIEISAFDGCSALSYVFYSGTPEQWDQIWIYGYLEDMDDAHAAYAQSVRDHLNAIVRFNTVDWGYCGGEGDGTNLVWALDNDGTLTISGNGAMADYTSASDAPWYSVSASIQSVVVKEGVTSIGAGAFYSGNFGDYAGTLMYVTIPKSVAQIGERAFGLCCSLQRFTVDADNACYASDDSGCLFNKDKTTLIQYPAGNPRTSFTIPDGVTTIGDWAFDDCLSLASVAMPNSVTHIGNCAFAYCGSLTNITLSKSLTTIGYHAFGECSITSIRIPDGVTSVGTNLFFCCNELKTVSLPASLTSIGGGTFFNCGALTNVFYGGSKAQWTAVFESENDPVENATVHYNVVDWGYCGAEGDGTNLVWTLDSDGTLTISGTGAMATYNLFPGYVPAPWRYDYSPMYTDYSIKKVVVEAGVTTISSYAFLKCGGLKYVVLPDTLSEISSTAFLGCENMHVFYAGSEAMWNQAFTGSSQSLDGEIHYNVVDWGYCGGEGSGTNLLWVLDNEGLLMISGEGAMANYSDSEPAPWSDYFAAPDASITVVLKDGVTTIGANAFPASDGLNELIILNRECEVSALHIKEPAMLRGYLGSSAMTYANEHDLMSVFKPLCDVDYRHTVEIIEGVDSTCKEPGHTPGIYCVECDNPFYGNETLPLENHTWGDWVTTKEATTETEGVRTRTCAVCDAKETQTIEKLTPTDNGGSDSNDDNNDKGGFFGWLQQAMKGLVAWFKKLLQFFSK